MGSQGGNCRSNSVAFCYLSFVIFNPLANFHFACYRIPYRPRKFSPALLINLLNLLISVVSLPSTLLITGRKKIGSSPNRVGGKDTGGFSAPGVRPVPDGTESAGTTRIPERILRFRKAPVPDPLRKTESQLQSGQLHHFPTRTVVI
jgi:hypothetical protein